MHLEMVGDIAILRMRAGKANAIGPNFLGGLIDVLDEFDRSGARAAILTGYDKYFSAGLDLVTLHEYDHQEMRDLITAFHHTMLRVYTCPKPIVAAVNGHAIAGGCVLAMQCDQRVMLDGDVRIGLNETRLGVGLPVIVVETFRNTVPVRCLQMLTLEGRLMTPGQALEFGLVNALSSSDQIDLAALTLARDLQGIPPKAYAQVKRSLRRPAVEVIQQRFDADTRTWLDVWFSETATVARAEAVARLVGR